MNGRIKKVNSSNYKGPSFSAACCPDGKVEREGACVMILSIDHMYDLDVNLIFLIIIWKVRITHLAMLCIKSYTWKAKTIGKVKWNVENKCIHMQNGNLDFLSLDVGQALSTNVRWGEGRGEDNYYSHNKEVRIFPEAHAVWLQKDWEPGTQIAFGLIPSTLLCYLGSDFFFFLVLTVFSSIGWKTWQPAMLELSSVLQLQVTENYWLSIKFSKSKNPKEGTHCSWLESMTMPRPIIDGQRDSIPWVWAHSWHNQLYQKMSTHFLGISHQRIREGISPRRRQCCS